MPLYDIKVPPEVRDTQLWQRTILFQFVYSLCGLVLGLVCTFGGIALLLHGVAGKSSWTAALLGLESDISDAPPGVILFIVGLLIVGVTRFRVTPAKRDKNESVSPAIDVIAIPPLDQLRSLVEKAIAEADTHGFHSFHLRGPDGIDVREARRFRDYFTPFISRMNSLVTLLSSDEIDEASALVHQFFSKTALNGWLDFPPVCYVLKDATLSLYHNLEARGGDIKRLSYAHRYVFRGWRELEAGVCKSLSPSDRRVLLNLGTDDDLPNKGIGRNS